MTLRETTRLETVLTALRCQLDNWNEDQVELEVETFENTVTVTFNKKNELSESAFW